MSLSFSSVIKNFVQQPLQFFLSPQTTVGKRIVGSACIASAVALTSVAVLKLMPAAAALLGRTATPSSPNSYQTFLNSNEPVIFSNVCQEPLDLILCQAIESAQTSIMLRTYHFSSREIIQSLSQQLKRGRSISLYYQVCKNIEELQQENQELLSITERSPQNRKLMHQKLLTVDSKEAWISTANFTRHSLVHDMNLLVGLKSPELCQCIEQNCSGSFLINKQPAHYFSLTQKLDKIQALKAVIGQIRLAKKRIQVAMLILSHEGIIKELQDAQSRGVSVEVIIDQKSRAQCLEKLQNYSCTFPVFCRTTWYILHCKMCIIDNSTLLVGSVNWSINGFQYNLESLLILEKLTVNQQKQLQKIWQSLRSRSQCMYSTEGQNIVKFQRESTV